MEIDLQFRQNILRVVDTALKNPTDLGGIKILPSCFYLVEWLAVNQEERKPNPSENGEKIVPIGETK